MKLVSVPLAAIVSSCATNWYWFGQEYRPRQQTPTQPFVEEPAPAAENATMEELRALLDDRAHRIAVLEARFGEAASGRVAPNSSEDVKGGDGGEGPRADSAERGAANVQGDPVADVVDAAARILRLVEDAMKFATDIAAAQIWAWPTDSASALLHGGKAPQAQTTSPWDAAAILESAWPGAMPQLREAASTVWRAGHDLAGATSSAVEARAPPELLTGFRAAGSAAASAGRDMLAQLEAAGRRLRQVSASVTAAFLEEYPAHAFAFARRDPMVVLALVAAGAVIVALDMFLCVRFFCRAVWLVLRLLGRLGGSLLAALGCRRQPGARAKSAVGQAQQAPRRAREKVAERAAGRATQRAAALAASHGDQLAGRGGA